MSLAYLAKTAVACVAVLGIATRLALNTEPSPLERKIETRASMQKQNEPAYDHNAYNAIICGGPIVAELLDSTEYSPKKITTSAVQPYQKQ